MPTLKYGSTLTNSIPTLPSKVRDDDDFIKDKLIENGKKTITLFIYDEKINEITNKYLN